MQGLTKTVTKAVQLVEGKAPKTIQRDATTLLLFDCEAFSQQQIDFVLQQYSDVGVSFESSNISSSGFIVIFSIQPQAAWFQRSSFAQAVLLFCVLVSVFAPHPA